MSDFEIHGKRVLLRDPRPDYAETYIRWMTVEREWGEWDAPWEGNEPAALDKSEVSQALSVAQLDTRQVLYIQVTDGPLLGWVNRYDHDPVGSIVWAGINICQSGSWCQGLGTEALRL